MVCPSDGTCTAALAPTVGGDALGRGRFRPLGGCGVETGVSGFECIIVLSVLPTHAHSMCRIYIHVSGRNLLVSFFQHMMCSFLFRSLVPPFRPWMSRVSQGHKHPADRPADLGVGKNT